MCGWLKTGMDIMADYSVTCSKLGVCADKEQQSVEVALWGVAEYGDAVGQAVGAMVGSGGGPAGTVIAEIIHRGFTDEEDEVFTKKFLTAGMRQ